MTTLGRRKYRMAGSDGCYALQVTKEVEHRTKCDELKNTIQVARGNVAADEQHRKRVKVCLLLPRSRESCAHRASRAPTVC
jgi:hypothetical protein